MQPKAANFKYPPLKMFMEPSLREGFLRENSITLDIVRRWGGLTPLSEVFWATFSFLTKGIRDIVQV